MSDNPIIREAIEVLKAEGYVVEERLGASMLWVQIPSGKWYSYYPTTCRWAPMANNSYPKKHYRSKSVHDFIERFLKPTQQKYEDVHG